jgi:hypothetical protein
MFADVAELVYAQALGACEAIHVGSSPTVCTKTLGFRDVAAMRRARIRSRPKADAADKSSPQHIVCRRKVGIPYLSRRKSHRLHQNYF